MEQRVNLEKRKFLLITILICLIGTAGLIGSVYHSNATNRSSLEHADYLHYSTAEDLVHSADVIVEGTVIKVTPNQEINVSKNDEVPISHLFDVADVQITQVLQGDLNVGDVIQVKQLVSDGSTYKKGTDGIFFLVDFSDFKEGGLPYSELNPNQGTIKIVDGKIKTDTSLFEKGKDEKQVFENGKDKKQVFEDIKKISLKKNQSIEETEEITLTE